MITYNTDGVKTAKIKKRNKKIEGAKWRTSVIQTQDVCRRGGGRPSFW